MSTRDEAFTLDGADVIDRAPEPDDDRENPRAVRRGLSQVRRQQSERPQGLRVARGRRTRETF